VNLGVPPTGSGGWNTKNHQPPPNYVHGRLPHLRRVAAQATNLDAYVCRMLVRVFLDERRLSWASVHLGAAPVEVAGPSTVDIESRLVLRWANTASTDDWKAITPFTYGPWDAVARSHAAAGDAQKNAAAAGIFGSDGALDPAGTRAALADLDAQVLVVTGDYDVGLGNIAYGSFVAPRLAWRS
jgi:hypothetical protein